MDAAEGFGTNWFMIAVTVPGPLNVEVGVAGAAVVVVVAVATTSEGKSSGSGTSITSISPLSVPFPVSLFSPFSVTDLMLLAIKNDAQPDLFTPTVLRMGLTSSE